MTPRPVAAAGMALVILAACQSPVAPSEPSQGSLSPSPLTSASLGPSRAPTGTSPAALASPTTSTVASAFAIHTVPREYTTPIQDLKTDGHEIVWSRGDATSPGAPDLWRYQPGDATPTLVLRNPNRDSTLMPIAVKDGRYAFVEANERLYGSGWKLWFLASAGGTPVGVDSADWQKGEPLPPLPYLALSDDRLVWSTLHHTPQGLRFELLSYALDSGKTTVLAASVPHQIEYWYPALDADGQRLVYATVEYAKAQAAFHVYLMDLARPSAPRRLDSDGRATNPVLSGDWIAWRSVASNGNLMNAGDLVELGSLAAASPGSVPVRQTWQLGPLTDLSAGDHDVAGWRDQDMDLEVLDLASGSPITVDRIPAGDEPGLERPVLQGNLLAYLHGYMDVQPLQLCWVELP